MINYLTAASASYGITVAVGAIIAICVAFFLSKKRGYYEDLVFDGTLSTLIFALIFARVFYVLFDIVNNDSAAYWTFAKIIGFDGSSGGLSLYGGLIGGALGLGLLRLINAKSVKADKEKFAYRDVTFAQTADLALSVLLLAQAIGCLGMLFGTKDWLNQIAFYEIFIDLFGFGILLLAYVGKRKSFDGFISCLYCIFYGIVNLITDGMSINSQWLIPGALKADQFFAAVMLFFGIALLLVHILQARKFDKNPFIFVNESELNNDYYGYKRSRVGKPSLESLRPKEDDGKPKFDDEPEEENAEQTELEEGRENQEIEEEKSQQEERE